MIARAWDALVRLLRFVRFSHTLFALPFAAGAMLVAARGFPAGRIVGLILLAMVAARTAAMTFNRLADWEIDKRNARTANRHRLISRGAAMGLLATSTALFVFAAGSINRLCLLLSPVALLLIFGYSLTKRFTHYSHFFLGLALAASPVGAWIAVTGTFALPPIILASAVVLWVAGFDLIYATQDYDFDRREGLRSMVVTLGIPRALRLAQWLHAGTWILLAAFGWSARLSVGYGIAMAAIAGMLVFEHQHASRDDILSINRAFFVANAIVGFLFLAGCAADVMLQRHYLLSRTVPPASAVASPDAAPPRPGVLPSAI
jgi:4-hydroxybenzoate polyprenyltransferase